MKISFDGFENSCITFMTEDSNLAEGRLVKISANGKVTSATTDDAFIGQVVSVKNGYATVCVKGVINVTYTGSAPDLGFTDLSGGLNGTLHTGTNGYYRFVLSVDTSSKTATIML